MAKVAVLLGGHSAEREVSLKSGKAVLNALLELGHDAFAFDPSERPLAELATLNVDKVFIALHGRGGEDGTVQGALEFMGMPYTGSGVLGSALAMDKVRCKHLFKAMNVATAPYRVVSKGEAVDLAELLAALNGCVMVKPAREGSSIGMSKADSVAALDAALAEAFRYDDVILLEQYVTGREFTVAVLHGDALPVIELKAANVFYDYHAKYQSSETQYLCPAPVSDAERDAMQQQALAAFALVGASGWGRVDIMMGHDGSLNVLEVNTVPGMTEKSLVPMAAKAVGLSFSQLVAKVLA